jgi:hypothetical protein
VVTYIIPLPLQHDFFASNCEISLHKFKTIQKEAPAFLADYKKKHEKSFVREALNSMDGVIELLDLKKVSKNKSHKLRMNLQTLRAVYLGRNLERRSLCTTTIIGKAVGLANIGTTLEDNYFIFNNLIGCALVSFDGYIDEKGIITGSWLVGFENVPGVVALFDFSTADTEVLPEEQNTTQLDELADIIVGWFKDRAWDMSSYAVNTICFTAEIANLEEH